MSEPLSAEARGIIAENARLKGIIRCATEAIITIDASQTIVIFNPMAEKLFGCPAHEALGAPLERFIPERYRAVHQRQVEKFGATGVSDRQMGRRLPLFGLRADGSEFPIEASISQLVDGDTRLFTVMLRDITERVKSEAELQASRNELRLLSANLQNAREQEQLRIARELHDDLGQRLSALKMDVSALHAEIAQAASMAAREALGRSERMEKIVAAGSAALLARTAVMQRSLDATVASVRRIASDLRPVMLDDLGLVAATEWLASEWRTRYGIIVRLALEVGLSEFRPEAATAIFRIIQEALNNVARHADATRAEVGIGYEGPDCIVRIADNGCGAGESQMAPSAGEPRHAFGLLGMSERARLLGGELVCESPAAGGFVVTATLPRAAVVRSPA